MRRSQLLAAVLLVLATPVATWWLVGDLSEDAPPAALSYSFAPPPVGGSVARWLGAGATAIALVALGVSAAGTWRRTLDRAWWPVLLPLVGLGAFAGWSYRVMTAGVVGANIGAGMVIFALPVVVISGVAGAIAAWCVGVRSALPVRTASGTATRRPGRS
jgi:hypothetical protein